MRRQDRAVEDQRDIEEIIRRAQICYLAMADGGRPYAVPMNFGYEDRTVYLHSAGEGRKMEILRQNPFVCLAFVDSHFVVPAESACGWSASYSSAIVEGTAGFIRDPDEKRAALDVIMGHYTQGPFTYSPREVESVCIIEVRIEAMTGKRSGDG